jgi:pimeloyl-ACP methyl ester carboxylesterase
MVAYAYAAQFPSQVEKLVVMDAFVPGVEGQELAYDGPNFLALSVFTAPPLKPWFKAARRFTSLISGNDLAADGSHSLPEADRASYVAAYSRPGRMRAGWAYSASWPDTAKDFAQMARTPLTMPVLSIAAIRPAQPSSARR